MIDYNLDELMSHKRTMRLIDRVISHDDKNIVAEVTINSNTTFFKKGVIPSWVGVEYAAQAVAAFSGICAKEKNEKNRVGFLLSCRRYKCTQSEFILGDVIEVHATEEFNDDNMGGYNCALYIRGAEVATVTLSAYIPDNINDMVTGGL